MLPNAPGLTLQPQEVLLCDYEGTGQPDIDEQFKAAWQLRAAGRFSEAAQSYEKLLEISGNCKEAVLNLGVCYLKLGQTAKARRLYVQSEAKSQEITYNYAIASLLRGKRYQALTAFRECGKDTQSALGTQARAAARLLETPSVPLASRPEPDFDFSMVVKKAVYRPLPRKKYQSLSLSNSIVGRQGLFPQQTVGCFPLPSRRELKSALRGCRQTNFRPKSSFQVRPKSRGVSSTDQSSARSRPLSVSLSEAEPGRNKAKLRRQGSLVEEDLEDEADLREKGLDMGIDREVHSIAAKLHASLEEKLRKQQYATCFSQENPPKDSLRAEDMQLIRMEMSKPSAERSLSALSAQVSRLKFFSKFKAEVREELLRLGTHLRISAHEYVFRQGDLGSQVYVVLHGSISVWRHAAEYGSEPLIVHTLYEGDSFGELSLFLAEST